jgi:hypothetical protein
MARYDNMLETIGNTPVVRIRRLAPPGVAPAGTARGTSRVPGGVSRRRGARSRRVAGW